VRRDGVIRCIPRHANSGPHPRQPSPLRRASQPFHQHKQTQIDETCKRPPPQKDQPFFSHNGIGATPARRRVPPDAFPEEGMVCTADPSCQKLVYRGGAVAGAAVADVIAGSIDPSGWLPVAWPPDADPGRGLRVESGVASIEAYPAARPRSSVVRSDG
jgi:hypothetical protein